MTPVDSRRLLPVVRSFVKNRPRNSAASSAIHRLGFKPSSERSCAGSAVISESALGRTIRLKRTTMPAGASLIAICRAVSRQISAWSSLLAITWTRRPSPPMRSHRHRPAMSVVFPFPRATCTSARRTRRRPSSIFHPTICATVHSCHGWRAKSAPVDSPTSESEPKWALSAATASQSM